MFLKQGHWGLPLQAEHRVFLLDSETAPLWKWHSDGTIDLYAMAGLTSFDSFDIARKRTIVHSVTSEGIENSTPINRWTLSHYIHSEGRDGHILVYALNHDAITDFIRVATKKFKKLGINLDWNDGGRFDLFAFDAAWPIKTLEELTFNRDLIDQYLVGQKVRETLKLNECTLLALGAFNLVDGLGQTAGRDICEGAKSHPCATTPDRNDNCCVTVTTIAASGLIYRDQWPKNIFRYVLAHECGHYVGLCHYGHDGFQNIMYTQDPDANLSFWDWGLFRYYLDSEPTFTLDDAKNVWRFLIGQLPACLDQPAPVIE
jgi:hypothetical protein